MATQRQAKDGSASSSSRPSSAAVKLPLAASNCVPLCNHCASVVFAHRCKAAGGLRFSQDGRRGIPPNTALVILSHIALVSTALKTLMMRCLSAGIHEDERVAEQTQAI